jgi:hypothetical protein
MKLNCLVQVNGNELDFVEWLDYHIALGFDAIFVFNNGNHTWLNAVCESRKDKVVVVPNEADWTLKSTIVEKYTARRNRPEWTICLSDDEFIWLDPKYYRNIKDLIFGSIANTGATACTLYMKYISSKEPMKSRVGTQIDCFTHIRREPEGYTPAIDTCPNSGATFFLITSPRMPLETKLVPVDQSRWCDVNGTQLSAQGLDRYMHSNQFSPMRFKARLYRFCPRSGVEMHFDAASVPKGFDIQDLSMQEARSFFLRVPVNPDTEKLFAKDIVPEKPVVVENFDGKRYEMSKDELAERELPVTKARICKMILKGMFFEDIRNELVEKYPDIDVAALERVFDFEREAILKTDHSYKLVQEMLDDGKTETEIRGQLYMQPTTYNRILKVLPVLDIHGTGIGRNSTIATPDPELKVSVEGESVEELAEQFNKSVEDNKMSKLEQEEVDAYIEERKLKKTLERKAGKKKTPATKGGKKGKKTVVAKAEAVSSAGDDEVVIKEFVPPSADDDGDFKLDIESDLIESASSKNLKKRK